MKSKYTALSLAIVGSVIVIPTIASGAITFDLRASSVSSGNLSSNKSVSIDPLGGTVTLQLWATVTSAAPSANPYGVQSITGSIRSTTAGTNTTGTMSTTGTDINAPWNNQSSLGVVAELSSPTDTVTDLGSNLTAPSTNFIKYRKDPTSGGQQVGTIFFATAGSPNGATFETVTNGASFLMGSATLTLGAFTSTSVSMNWVIPTFGTVINKKTIAQWTDGDNVVNEGSTNAAEMFIGSPVVITALAVPEPTSFAMLMIGSLGLVGFRRPSFRRSA